jgi:hypothetical protein
MKIVNFILAVLFLTFAFVQINDPDPVVWILIYGGMAVICIMAIFEFYVRKVLIVLAVLLAAYSLFFIPGVLEWLQNDNKSALFDEVAKMEHLYIEESREFLGLWICISTLLFYLFRASKFSMR